MARKVIWADGAVADLDAAADYISKDSPAYAASFVLQSLKAARSLGDLPERGRVVPEFKREDIREIFVFSYRLIYRIDELRVSVLAFIHGRRDFSQAWDERKR
jgi:plasmid stabilization system protein ParE